MRDLDKLELQEWAVDYQCKNFWLKRDAEANLRKTIGLMFDRLLTSRCGCQGAGYKNECVNLTLSKLLDKFDGDKGKAFNYITTILLSYMKQYGNKYTRRKFSHRFPRRTK